jgi:osomolarity two-component system sensor histidine kinase NIK1
MTSIPREQIIERLAPWSGRYILFIDTLGDTTGVADMLKELNLKPIVVHSVDEVKSLKQGPGMPTFDTMIVDSLCAVRFEKGDNSLCAS